MSEEYTGGGWFWQAIFLTLFFGVTAWVALLPSFPLLLGGIVGNLTILREEEKMMNRLCVIVSTLKTSGENFGGECRKWCMDMPSRPWCDWWTVTWQWACQNVCCCHLPKWQSIKIINDKWVNLKMSHFCFIFHSRGADWTSKGQWFFSYTLFRIAWYSQFVRLLYIL